MGAPALNGNGGAVYVYAVTLPTLTLLTSQTGQSSGASPDRLGLSVAGTGFRTGSGVGDLDGNGVPETIWAAPTKALPGQNSGRVSVRTLIGLPVGTTAFASGCPGSGGFEPQIGVYGGSPTAGTGNPDFRAGLSRDPDRHHDPHERCWDGERERDPATADPRGPLARR